MCSCSGCVCTCVCACVCVMVGRPGKDVRASLSHGTALRAFPFINIQLLNTSCFSLCWGVEPQLKGREEA